MKDYELRRLPGRRYKILNLEMCVWLGDVVAGNQLAASMFPINPSTPPNFHPTPYHDDKTTNY